MDKKNNIIKGLYNIAVDVTYRCNYLCKHCYNSSGDNIYKNKNVKITWADHLEHIFRAAFKPEDAYLYLSIKANGNITASPYLPLSFGNVKKYALTQYWEKGLFNIWSFPIVKNYLNELMCIDDMGLENTDLPKIWHAHDIMFDIIDNNILV